MRTLPASVLATLLLSACGSTGPDRNHGDPRTDVGSKLRAFADCNEFSDYLVDSFVETIVQSRYGYGYGRGMDDVDSDAESSGSEAPDDYSTTNVQESGVDEPDIVKTDGTYIYVVQQARAELTIVDSWPAEDAAVVGRVELAGQPYSAFLRGDTMAVFQYVYDEGRGTGVSSELRHGYGTRISLIDVSDRTNPVVIRDLDFEGWLSSARLVEDDVYVVMNNWFSMPESLYSYAWDETIDLPEHDWEASEAELAAKRAEARRILYPLVRSEVDAMDIGAMLPHWYGGQDGAWTEEGTVLACSDVYHPEGVAQPGLLTMVHLDLAAPETTTPSATGLFANGWTVYASLDSLYVSQTSWWWGWGWDDSDLVTHVHRFALEGEDSVYASSGEVPGWQWSQFALDEQDGLLRMATTSQDWWWGGSEGEEGGSGVYVLEEHGAELDVIGQVDGIAPGETIQGVRFIDDIAWLVTFLQVDPLFAIDLSVPTAPRVIGELKIPGFSSYIHPLEGGYLLTAGMAGTDDGDLTGFSVKLFDVRDPTNPTLLDDAVVSSDDWSWSEALWDHHAFTFHNGVLTVPIYTYDYDDRTGDWNGFSGLWVLDVDTDLGLTELGRVDHADMVAASDCLYYYDDGPTGPCPDDWWYAFMRRGVIMEDKLFSVSDYGIKVTELRTPETTVGSALFWPSE